MEYCAEVAGLEVRKAIGASVKEAIYGEIVGDSSGHSLVANHLETNGAGLVRGVARRIKREEIEVGAGKSVETESNAS